MLLDGRKMAKEIEAVLSNSVQGMQIPPKLVVVQVGNDKATESFINVKSKCAERIGIKLEVKKFPSETSEAQILKVIQSLNTDTSVSGMIVQLPLPAGIDAQKILSSINPDKDPDVLSPEAYARFVAGDSSILPPVVGAISKMLTAVSVDLENSDIAIVGFGKLVGQPVAEWLKHQGLEYVVATSETKDLTKLLANADVIISGAGSPNIIRPEMIKEGVVILDAGTSDMPATISGEVGGPSKLVGDVDPACASKASFMSPVPGGVGPLAVALLFHNLLILSLSVPSAK